MPRTEAGRIALVTGASRGLGHAVARRLHADGFRVALGDRNVEAAAAVARSLDATGATARVAVMDLSDPPSIEAGYTGLVSEWGAPEVLVNNAGITAKRSLWDIELDEWDTVLNTNLRGTFVLSRLAARPMRERGWGRIVNMSSYAGQQGGLVAGAHYASSKAGQLVLTKIFARELAGDGVTVNAIAPAAVLTPAMGEPDGEEAVRLAGTIPIGRVGDPDEVAAAVAYLVGPDSGFVTGATIDLNGGMFMR
ncbi:SDR family NAD(P)-dependent oxidoreductase [Microbacterium sp. 18062]|uniref:SDR family oxidoreductase n=1 Tax=Microbacterium sp. 18062 TaxID=2681410 RepID=UPI0013577A8B|nr:SDR family NAD(P)-dependent oxidoreductase [Microbacterium sp. 18062]